MQAGISSFIIRFVFIVGCLFIFSCKKDSDSIQLKFLDEYVVPNDLLIDSTVVGGLSGIDFHNGTYYLVCDDSKNPRYYGATIELANFKFDTVKFKEMVAVEPDDNFLDLESIVIDPITEAVLLVSEGKIKEGKNPMFFSVNQQGQRIENFEIPNYFKADSKQKPRDNGVFEGLSVGFENKGYWVAAELPLEADGPKPIWGKTIAPVRLTYFDSNKKATKQIAYLLDQIAKKPLGNFAVNGVVDVLGYSANTLFVMERSYSTGYGNQGNVVKIYSVAISEASNTLDMSQLKAADYKPVVKKLLLNFEELRTELSNKSVDNIEGICFGPLLPNGNRSLIVVADNNFREDQINQFILLEIID
tara:strand:- start:455516 stop:456595 length:1080 start_codon:yes stop_codon:yes gene_type:complete